MLIRTAEVEDAPSINNLSHQLGYHVPIHQTADNIRNLASNPHSAIFVAEDTGDIIGWLHIYYKQYLESAPFCEIVGLVVDETQRGKGIGRLLIDKAKEWARSMNTGVLKVRTNVKRAETHEFYTRQGFNCIKEQKVFITTL